MINKEYISVQERDAYMEDFTDIILSTVKQVIGLANKFNVDRDDALEHFAVIFKAMQETCTFRNWRE